MRKHSVLRIAAFHEKCEENFHEAKRNGLFELSGNFHRRQTNEIFGMRAYNIE